MKRGNGHYNMKIAVISTLYKVTPPSGYGGIERVVYNLTEQLIKDGHDVVLFGLPGSYCSAKTIEVGYDGSQNTPSGINKKSDVVSEEPLYIKMKEYLRDNPVDIIHDWSFQNLYVLRHPESFPFIISTCIPPFAGYKRPNLIASSKAHAGLFSGSTRYVYYGLNLNEYRYNYSKKEHFIHIAKIARYKGQHLAIGAFRRTSEKLRIAGNIEDRLYYSLLLRPLIFFTPNVSYIGEISNVNDFLCEARALIQTPRWFDAFPFVILEAFASGTPVISFPEGGIPEQIVHGLNGFLCKDVKDMIEAIKHISSIRPEDCRAYAEEYFSAERMARDYMELYKRAIEGETW